MLELALRALNWCETKYKKMMHLAQTQMSEVHFSDNYDKSSPAKHVRDKGVARGGMGAMMAPPIHPGQKQGSW